MKKIGLVSVHNPNYGSMLQTYALHSYLKEIGQDNEIILYKKTKNWKQFIRIFNLPLLKMKRQVIFRDLYCRLFHYEVFKDLQKRKIRFNEFKKEHFTFSKEYVGWNNLLKTNELYDTFIIGSDQVWNPINIGTDFFNLLFVNKNKYKISYASSFGVSAIPSMQRKKTAFYLNRIQHLSTRELTGQKIIKELTGRNAALVCDPTLLIDKIYWDRIKGNKAVIEGKYIFCYFLGNNPSHRDFANKFSAKTGLRIVALQHLDEFVKSDIGFADIKPFNIGPGEFVNLVSNAEYVLTDSFHGSIFSILYRKIFFTFSRFECEAGASTNSRIDSLLALTGISERHIKPTTCIEECLEMQINFDAVHERVAEYRNFSRKWLCNALREKND